ncbi:MULTISPECIES: hypothetical protein [unclassified Pseudonocardia]|uniref:hypothetical protein n=1 Tax=unclassified Pseudonocardia TaxID=2619320 RepID=UPI0011153E2F|nr:hypothetical protein [Pseudonocardia sp. Ae707_Ps1]
MDEGLRRDKQSTDCGVQRAAASVHEMGMKRILLPGQRLRQKELAQEIGIGRGSHPRGPADPRR